MTCAPSGSLEPGRVVAGEAERARCIDLTRKFPSPVDGRTSRCGSWQAMHCSSPRRSSLTASPGGGGCAALDGGGAKEMGWVPRRSVPRLAGWPAGSLPPGALSRSLISRVRVWPSAMVPSWQERQMRDEPVGRDVALARLVELEYGVIGGDAVRTGVGAIAAVRDVAEGAGVGLDVRLERARAAGGEIVLAPDDAEGRGGAARGGRLIGRGPGGARGDAARRTASARGPAAAWWPWAPWAPPWRRPGGPG